MKIIRVKIYCRKIILHLVIVAHTLNQNLWYFSENHQSQCTLHLVFFVFIVMIGFLTLLFSEKVIKLKDI